MINERAIAIAAIGDLAGLLPLGLGGDDGDTEVPDPAGTCRSPRRMCELAKE